MIKEKDNNNDNLKRGLLLVFFANIINLCISLINGFVLPKYLSVESYADIKTYHLYANYITVLAFGYSDGLYLFYGGKKKSEVTSSDINICRSNLFFLQLMTTIIGICFGYLTKNNILLITAISIVPVNIVSAYKNIFQAIGEFKTYSNILNLNSILVFIGTIVLLLFIRSDNSYLYIGWAVIITFVIWLLVEKKIQREFNQKIMWQFSLVNLMENVKSGIVLMLGNFSSILMTTIDRWFVKGLLTTTDFAFYSFVVSVENLIAIFITPIVTTMYNYICVTPNMDKIRQIKRMCLVFSLFLISGAFPVKFILEVYLQKYIAARYVLFILFSTEVFFMLIKGIYVNIYKARKQQSKYFKQLLCVIIIGIVLNVFFYYFTRCNEGIAFATLISVVIWYIVCCVSVPIIKPDLKETMFLVTSIVIFIVAGFFLKAVVGFLVYLACIFVLSMLLMRESLRRIKELILGMIKKRLCK